MNAKKVEPFNSIASQLLQLISHKTNFDADNSDVESEKANTPFEDATRILRTALNVDRAAALDSFMLNSCLVHDMTVVTDALFSHEKNGEMEDDGVEAVGA